MIWPSRNAAPSARTARRISPATTRPEVKWRAASCCGSRRLLILWKAPSALVAIHDGALPSDDAGILNMLNRYGAAFLQRLCRLKLADLAAHARNAGVMQREQQVRAFEGRMLELSATACYTVGQLAVNGASLMDAGITPGPAVGKALNTLLRAVMEGRLPNEKAALLAALEKEGLL